MTGAASLSQRSGVVTTTTLDALRLAAQNLESEITDGPIFPVVTAEEIRSHLTSRYDFREPIGLEELGADVEHMLRTWDVQVTHPRYFGLFNPSVTLASVVADTLVAMYNPQLATWSTSPGAIEIERHTLAWLADKFGLPHSSFACFTSGGSEANLSAVTVGLTRSFPGYGDSGLRSLPGTPTIYLTTEAHHSYNKIAHMTGLGRNAIRIVATDRDLKMDVLDLEKRVTEDRKAGHVPFLVVGTAGTTAAGIIDPLALIARFCQSEGLWFHVDAAWGGAAAISPTLKKNLIGIESADSITCDAHKWFSVPLGAGMFFCRHADWVAATFHANNSYMPQASRGSVVDPYTSTVQWSRRFTGLKLFLAVANSGEAAYIQRIEHQTRMGGVLRALLKQSGWRVVNNTPLPLVCFTRDGLDHAKLLATLKHEQIAWMSQALVAGIPVIRACITSFRTQEADLQWVVNEMNRITQ